MACRFSLGLLAWYCAIGVSAGCSVVVGADFDVQGRSPGATDAGDRKDANLADAPADALPDAGAAVRPDADDAAELDAHSGGANDGAAVRPDADDAAELDAHSGGANDAADEGDGIDARDAAVDPPLRDAVDVIRPEDGSDGDGDAGTDGPADVIEAGPDLRPTVTGGFVTLGVPSQLTGPIELRGQVMTNAVVRGSSASGITIEGRFQ